MTLKKHPIVIAAAFLVSYPTIVLAGDDSKARPPVPAGNPGKWVTMEDYPFSALRSEAEGVTRFTLKIDAEGAPAECNVTNSSGHDDLDSTTCALMEERARFKPALDAQGKPVAATWSSSVRWMIGETNVLPAPEAYSLTLQYIIEKDGTISGCKVLSVENQGGDPCQGTSSVTYSSITDKRGNPVRKIVTQQIKITVEDAPK